jgi:hypothetical protein
MGVLKPVWGIGGELASLRTIEPGRTMKVTLAKGLLPDILVFEREGTRF